MIFIIETTNGEEWETNHGFHLVHAENEELAIITANRIVKETIVRVNNIKDFMNANFHSIESGELKTIIQSGSL